MLDRYACMHGWKGGSQAQPTIRTLIVRWLELVPPVQADVNHSQNLLRNVHLHVVFVTPTVAAIVANSKHTCGFSD